jgi:hypothetical protein
MHHGCDEERFTADGMSAQDRSAWIRQARKRAGDPDWDRD